MHFALKKYSGMGMKLHTFVISELLGGQWSALHFCCFAYG